MSLLRRLFGESEPSKAVADMPTKERISIDQQIHNDLHLSCQQLLDSIQEELSPLPYSEEDKKRYKKLSNIGFTAVPEVEQYNQDIITRRKQLEERKLINHYAQKYPLNKFITENAVDTLCKRYGLILGEVRRFKGQIPLKNQEEIVNFKVAVEDGEYMGSGFIGEGLRRLRYRDYNPDDPHLHIVAPQQMFNLTNAEIKGNRIYEIKDPIVLQPVKGGWLIITAWGAEANDLEVINPKKN